MAGSRGHVAFTAIDLLILLSAVGLLAMFLSYFVRTPRRSSRINCLSNVKQIAVAFRMYANDHGEQFPMAVSKDDDGAKEAALAGQALPIYRVMENELNTPKVLSCSEDKERQRTSAWSGLANNNLSYLVGLDAAKLNPQTILLGDRSFTLDGVQLRPGLTALNDPARVGWSKAIHQSQSTLVPQAQGNIGLADGSAYQVTVKLLEGRLRATGLPTNRFVVP